MISIGGEDEKEFIAVAGLLSDVVAAVCQLASE